MLSIFNFTEMKENTFAGGSECCLFRNNNKFPPNTFKFKPKNHMYDDNIERCLLNIKGIINRQQKGYMRSYYNSPEEYFYMINKNIPRPTYIVFNGIPMTLEEIQIWQDKINYASNQAKIMNSCYFKYREAVQRIFP